MPSNYQILKVTILYICTLVPVLGVGWVVGAGNGLMRLRIRSVLQSKRERGLRGGGADGGGSGGGGPCTDFSFCFLRGF